MNTQQPVETVSAASTPKWTIDPAHSQALFTVRHLMITNVRGEFQKLSGTVVFDPARPEATRIDVVIDVASINTREPKRDDHLRSADFFDVAQFPHLTFTSNKAERTDGGWKVTGDLTIHGVTKPVVLDVEGPGAPIKDPWGQQRIAATAKTKIKRSDFGMTWNMALELGGVTVSDEVKIELDISLVKPA